MPATPSGAVAAAGMAAAVGAAAVVGAAAAGAGAAAAGVGAGRRRGGAGVPVGALPVGALPAGAVLVGVDPVGAEVGYGPRGGAGSGGRVGPRREKLPTLRGQKGDLKPVNPLRSELVPVDRGEPFHRRYYFTLATRRVSSAQGRLLDR
jgi:hypothetical protein